MVGSLPRLPGIASISTMSGAVPQSTINRIPTIGNYACWGFLASTGARAEKQNAVLDEDLLGGRRQSRISDHLVTDR